MQLKMFTWNMQRGSSIVPPTGAEQKIKAAARREVLELLCNWSDVGFITEAGQDLVRAVSAPVTTSGLLPGGIGWWNCSRRQDGQKGPNACKNLLFSKRKLIPAEISYQSGADDCYRYPAAGYFPSSGNPRVLLVSLHATSGGGGRHNSDDLFNHFDEGPTKRAWADVVLVGGDMNFNHHHFEMPAANTHQSGSKLDGFAHDKYDDDYWVDVSKVKVVSFQGDLELRETGSDRGCFYNYQGTWTRVSDHAPVYCILSVNQTPDADSDAPSSSGTSRKKQKLGPS